MSYSSNFILEGSIENAECSYTCEISSSHGSEYEVQNLLGCTAVFLTECRPTFQLRTRQYIPEDSELHVPTHFLLQVFPQVKLRHTHSNLRNKVATVTLPLKLSQWASVVVMCGLLHCPAGNLHVTSLLRSGFKRKVPKYCPHNTLSSLFRKKKIYTQLFSDH
jgi:hypothetical protein